MRLASLTTAALAATAALSATGTAQAANGHGCRINGLAAGCPAGFAIPAGSDLIGTDGGLAAADDFVFAGPGNAVRCRDATFKAILTSAGGPAFPIGGLGPGGYVTGASITGPFGARCAGVVGGAAAPASVSLLDGNGAAPGLVDFRGDWIGGFVPPRLALRAPVFLLRELLPTGAVISCTYRGGAFTAAVTNSPAGRVIFGAQPVNKLAGPALCPPVATISVPFNVRWALGGVASGPFRISA
jgi:hypothetical protein